MLDYAPQRPGKLKIDYEPGGAAEISIDGYRLEQFVTRMTLTLDAAEKPVLTLDLLPSLVDVTAGKVSLRGDFRDFLIAQGWQPPS